MKRIKMTKVVRVKNDSDEVKVFKASFGSRVVVEPGKSINFLARNEGEIEYYSKIQEEINEKAPVSSGEETKIPDKNDQDTVASASQESQEQEEEEIEVSSDEPVSEEVKPRRRRKKSVGDSEKTNDDGTNSEVTE